MMPPSVHHTVPASGELAHDGVVEIHGHTLHVLDDDALVVVDVETHAAVHCPVDTKTFNEGDLTSDFPGSMQVRCVISVDVSGLQRGRDWAIRLNLLSDVFETRFRLP
jgi:hypothetical protein